MDIKRLSSAILGLPMVIVVILLGNKYVIDVALAVVALISLHEYYNSFSKNYKPIQWLGYLLAICISFIHLVPTDMLFKIISLTKVRPSICLFIFTKKSILSLPS